MTRPRFSFIPAAGHEMHVTEWGAPYNRPLILWHGLARTGRDFDELAAGLSDHYFVLCPDTIGRGLSSWSDRPEEDYSIAAYCELAFALMDHYRIKHTDWLGTSMGGLIGMRMASGPMSSRISRLIINDIGPEIPQVAIDRILSYAGTSPSFATLTEAEHWLRTTYQPFGPASDAFWSRMTRSSVRRLESGKLTVHYDPKITLQFSVSADELSTWDRFARIDIPMHVIRGATSDILLPPIAERMVAQIPGLAVSVVEECGHAPTLSRQQDIDLVRGILAHM
ncbi:MAG: alpha/beta hydrolase [Pseudomonadota bacterium]